MVDDDNDVQLPWYGSRLMDHWACYREIMYIHLMCEGSSLLSNIICSVLDVKSFYLSLVFSQESVIYSK